MSGSVHLDGLPALANDISIETIFGQTRYLENIALKLQKQGVYSASDLVALSVYDFERVVGRITEDNKRRIEARMAELGLRFIGPQ